VASAMVEKAARSKGRAETSAEFIMVFIIVI
jgi:hypothetical protein